jgi:quercetin dioxygenase-like cupin family protein
VAWLDNTREVQMNVLKRLAGPLLVVVCAAAVVGAQSPAIGLARLTPEEITWPAATGCVQQAVVAGDLKREGLYAVQMKFAAGCRIQPHAHPRDRVITVLSGTMHLGFGATFDEKGLKALPPGSVWTEPAAQPHFGWARDTDVVLHVSGIGPYAISPAGE